MNITREVQIEIARYTAMIKRSQRAYYGEEVRPCGCSHLATCTYHRGLAAADLRVATSEEECRRLLAILDRPTPLCIRGCGRRQDGRRDGTRRLCWACRRAEKEASA